MTAMTVRQQDSRQQDSNGRKIAITAIVEFSVADSLTQPRYIPSRPYLQGTRPGYVNTSILALP